MTVQHDPAATVRSLVAMESLFRLGIASFFIDQVAFLILPLVLYQLLRSVNHPISVLMVALAVVSVPIALGVFLMLGFCGYMVNVFGRLLVPHYANTIVSNYAGLPAAIGEIGACLWLLLVGVRAQILESAATGRHHV